MKELEGNKVHFYSEVSIRWWGQLGSYSIVQIRGDISIVTVRTEKDIFNGQNQWDMVSK